MRVYLDSCMLIYFIEHSPVYGMAIRAKLFGLRPRICWTYLTRLECRTRPLREKNTALLKQFEDFFEYPNSICLGLENSTFNLATELRARHALKTPDALHLAAAIEGDCEEFWTNDHRLDTAASAYLATVIF
jgi:predicted nucleic acid-binding protein